MDFSKFRGPTPLAHLWEREFVREEGAILGDIARWVQVFIPLLLPCADNMGVLLNYSAPCAVFLTWIPLTNPTPNNATAALQVYNTFAP